MRRRSRFFSFSFGSSFSPFFVSPTIGGIAHSLGSPIEPSSVGSENLKRRGKILLRGEKKFSEGASELAFGVK